MSDDRTLAEQFRRDVVTGLRASPKKLSPKYFYDALGSRIFDAICELPWYAVTRAEGHLIARHLPKLVKLRPGTIIELGPGNGAKLSMIVGAMRGRLASVQLIDVSTTALEAATAEVSRVSDVKIVRRVANFEDGLRTAMRTRLSGRPVLVMLLGSTIGNYEPEQRAGLLRHVRRYLQPGDSFLVGADLVKPAADLRLAYDDPLQVTAAFNKNLLVRINRELNADFDLGSFRHRAIWNSPESRVEMHLVSTKRQFVRLRRVRASVLFHRGESIWTESSYKFDPRQLLDIGRASGLDVANQWIDSRYQFALTLYKASGLSQTSDLM